MYRLFSDLASNPKEGAAALIRDAADGVSAASCNFHQDAACKAMEKVLAGHLGEPLSLSVAAARLFGGDIFSDHVSKITQLLGDKNNPGLLQAVKSDGQTREALNSMLADLSEKYPLSDTGYGVLLEAQTKLLQLGMQSGEVKQEELDAYYQSVHDAIPARATIASFPEIAYSLTAAENEAFSAAWSQGNNAAIDWLQKHRPDIFPVLTTLADSGALQANYRKQHPAVKAKGDQ